MSEQTKIDPPGDASAPLTDRCLFCRFWLDGQSILARARHWGYDLETLHERSSCRRHGPFALMIVRTEYRTPEAAWPVTAANEWCGEFELRPETVDADPTE